jgi:hypothetical protein
MMMDDNRSDSAVDEGEAHMMWLVVCSGVGDLQMSEKPARSI